MNALNRSSKVNILSLFNGISGLHLSCDRAGVEVGTCYYSEIDEFANKVTEHHYPNDIALGNVTKWREWGIDWASIDLVGAGFPCQAWSVAGKQLGDKDERGMLFWTTLEIIAHVLKHNPKAKFLMENVKMKNDFEEYITHHTTQALGYVEKTLINSALVSAQNRNRYYWTNFPVTQPEDKGILLRDILECDGLEIPKGLKEKILSGEIVAGQNLTGESQTMGRCLKNSKSPDDKANTLTACFYKGMQTNSATNVLVQGGAIRGRYNSDGSTSQKLECNNQEKTNSLTTVQKDNVVVYSTADNPRIKGITEDERGFRPHKGDRAKSGISECGRILKETADKTDTLTASHAPKVLVNESASIVVRATVQKNAEHTNGDKSPTLTAAMGIGGGNVPLLTDSETASQYKGKYIDKNDRLEYRKLTPLECERLQTLPDNWTDCISKTQRYRSIGNGWTIDVIAHILKHIKNPTI